MYPIALMVQLAKGGYKKDNHYERETDFRNMRKSISAG